MALLSKANILDKDDLKFEIVHIPEWGGDVKVITMSGFERDKFEASVSGKNGGLNTQNIRARLAAHTLVDDNGDPLFNESDLMKLGKKSSAALDRIFAVAQRLNLITNTEVENLAKN